MPAPSFLCVGMPKCGTSTLHDVFSRQREIFVPPVKEIKFLASAKIQYSGSPYELFFSKHWAARQDRSALLRIIKRTLTNENRPKDLAWSLRYAFVRRDLQWYFSLFSEDHISGDVSPVYHVLERKEIKEIASAMPDLKVIILLRSPLQQIWSHCRMVVVRLRKKNEGEAFKEHIEKMSRSRRTFRGLVEDWSSEFGEQVFIGYLEDMATNPARFFSDLFHFLGVEKPEGLIARDPFVLGAKSHVGIPYDVPEDVRTTLADHADIRMEGFETIAPDRATEWRNELEDFRRAEPEPHGSLVSQSAG